MKRKDKIAPARQLFDRRYGLRWGRLLEGLAVARYSLAVSYGERSLLPKILQDELQDLHHRLSGLEQQAWGAETMSAEEKDPWVTKKSKPRRASR